MKRKEEILCRRPISMFLPIPLLTPHNAIRCLTLGGTAMMSTVIANKESVHCREAERDRGNKHGNILNIEQRIARGIDQEIEHRNQGIAQVTYSMVDQGIGQGTGQEDQEVGQELDQGTGQGTGQEDQEVGQELDQGTGQGTGQEDQEVGQELDQGTGQGTGQGIGQGTGQGRATTTVLKEEVLQVTENTATIAEPSSRRRIEQKLLLQ